MKNTILLQHNYAELTSIAKNSLNISIVATIVSNMAYYGYCPDKSLFEAIQKSSNDEINLFWKNLEPALIKEKAVDRNMNDVIVYKNFPEEVLSMSQAEYWFNQILMYAGLNEFAQKEDKVNRSRSIELKDLTALSLSDNKTLSLIFKNNLSIPNDWTTNQLNQSISLLSLLAVTDFSISDAAFKLNAINIASNCLNKDISVTIKDATDVIRLALFMSGYEDAKFSPGIRFKRFKRSERRFFLSLLENSKNLEADVALNKKIWKGFLTGLHPSDYKFTKVISVFDKLYNNKITSFQGKVDKILKSTFPDYYRQKESYEKDFVVSNTIADCLDDGAIAALMNFRSKAKPLDIKTTSEKNINSSFLKLMDLFKSRHGEFLRQFHMLYGFFGDKIVNPLSDILHKVKPVQLLKFDTYLASINDRESLIYAPNGKWSKANFVNNNKSHISNSALTLLRNEISNILALHVNGLFPDGIDLDPRLKSVKLQTNSQELAPYGRGTRFSIPDNITFIRSGSYWQTGDSGNIWYDNGWNFFDDSWSSVGTCCWDNERYSKDAAIFSGDPTTASTSDGRACQMIDLYIDKLLEKGVRYAVWNILGFSGKSFSEAKEVIATFQLGENPTEDEIYDPSRAQMVFPLSGSNLTKYIAYIDLKSREIVYLDANLYGDVQSASLNEDLMSERMPDVVEYLNSVPSIFDLLKHGEKGNIPFMFDDKYKAITSGKAYVFNPLNSKSNYEKIDMVSVL